MQTLIILQHLYLTVEFVPNYLTYRCSTVYKHNSASMGGCGTAEKKITDEGYEQHIKNGESNLIAEFMGNSSSDRNQRIPWKKAFEKIQQHIKNDQRKLIDETYQISDPGLLCPSSNKIVYACLHKNCIQTQKCFRCEKKSCPTCSKQHQFHGNQFHIEELTKQLRLRAIEQKKLLNKLEEIQAKAINELKTKKIIQFDKFNLKGLQEKYARIIENFYVKRSTVDIKGSLLNELTEKLIEINEKSSDYSQQLVREFQKQTFKIITTWQILQNQIIQKFNAYTRSGIRKVVYTQQSPASFRKSASSFEHPNNPHNKHFKITESLTSYSITKTTTDDFYCSFVKNGVIFSNTITSFKLHFTKMNGKVVLIGIATKSIFGVKEAYTHKEAITYASSTGNIWQNGDSRKGGKGIKQGQVLMLRVDTINWQVVWCIGCDELAKTSIPDSMKKQGLYMVIMMLDKDGTVQYLT